MTARHVPVGFYPAPHPGVVHSLTDESIAVDALRDSTNNSSEQVSSSSAAPPASTDEEVVDTDSEKPVSIAQVRQPVRGGQQAHEQVMEAMKTEGHRDPGARAGAAVAIPVRFTVLGRGSGEDIPAAHGDVPQPGVIVMPSHSQDGAGSSSSKDEVVLEALVLGTGGLLNGGGLNDGDWRALRQVYGPDVAVLLVREGLGEGVSEGDPLRRRPFVSGLSILSRIVIRVGALAFQQLIRPQLQAAGLGGLGGLGGSALGGLGAIGGLGGGLLG